MAGTSTILALVNSWDDIGPFDGPRARAFVRDRIARANRWLAKLDGSDGLISLTALTRDADGAIGAGLVIAYRNDHVAISRDGTTLAESNRSGRCSARRGGRYRAANRARDARARQPRSVLDPAEMPFVVSW